MLQKEIVILSLINEKPSHGYSLEEKIEERGMRNWTDIGFSSIYRIISTLEKKALVESEIVQEKGEGRIQKKYTITNKGKIELKKAVLVALETSTRMKSNFDLGLANIWLLSKEEALEALNKYLQGIDDRNKQMNESWNKLGEKERIPFLVNALFEHAEVMMKAERNFVQKLIAKIEMEGI